MMFRKLVLLSFCSAICALALGCGGGANTPDPAKEAEGDAMLEKARQMRIEMDKKRKGG
jgi:hypothetical protein